MLPGELIWLTLFLLYATYSIGFFCIIPGGASASLQMHTVWDVASDKENDDDDDDDEDDDVDVDGAMPKAKMPAH